MVGRATWTMVTSTRSMKVAPQTAIRVHQRRSVPPVRPASAPAPVTVVRPMKSDPFRRSRKAPSLNGGPSRVQTRIGGDGGGVGAARGSGGDR